jgi:hypothetical protein
MNFIKKLNKKKKKSIIQLLDNCHHIWNQRIFNQEPVVFDNQV